MKGFAGEIGIMDNDSTGFLVVEVVYVDEYSVKLATSFVTTDWRARATAWTQFETIGRFTDELAAFIPKLVGEVVFEADNDVAGGLGLRFHTTGEVRHLFCHLQLVSIPVAAYPPVQPWKVSVELATEAAALDGFIAGLRRIVEDESGKATLKLTNHWF